jgi:hypothetical protein
MYGVSWWLAVIAKNTKQMAITGSNPHRPVVGRCGVATTAQLPTRRASGLRDVVLSCGARMQKRRIRYQKPSASAKANA